MFEHDCMIELFSSDYGKQRLLVKYALTKTSKVKGLLNVSYCINGSVFQRHQFHFLKDISLKQTFLDAPSNYHRYETMFYMIQSIRVCTEFDQLNPNLYELLCHGLSDLANCSDLSQLCMNFINQLLIMEGLSTAPLPFHKAHQKMVQYANKSIQIPQFLQA